MIYYCADARQHGIYLLYITKKLAVAVNTEGHSIRVLNERSVSDGGNFVSNVVGDSQISLTLYWRHLTAAVQLALNCSELYFDRCCALNRTAAFSSESKVTCLF